MVKTTMKIKFITLLKRVQRNLRMAASDFVAPLLTGEKKDGGPPGLLGTKSVQTTINSTLFSPNIKHIKCWWVVQAGLSR